MFRKWKNFVVFSIIAAFLFTLVPTIGTDAAGSVQVEINKRTNTLYYYENGRVVKTYRVATGRTSGLTPEGTFTVTFKTTYPGWKNIPGGDPKNPLGTRWIGIQVNGDRGRTYGIHGTNNPSSIGTHASSGCVRMHNSNVEDLYKKVPVGTKVWIHSGTSNNVWRGVGGGTTTPPSVTPDSGTLKVTGTSVNVRSGSSLSASIIGKANRPQTFQVTGKSGVWYRINYNGRTGFIHSDYATKTTSSTPKPPAPQPSGYITTTENMTNIRAAASLNSQVLQRVSAGTRIVRVGTVGDFYQVRLKSGQIAYVHKSVAKPS